LFYIGGEREQKEPGVVMDPTTRHNTIYRLNRKQGRYLIGTILRYDEIENT